MCGRFTLRTPLTVLAKQFQFELDFADKGPRYNIAPTQDVPVVRIADGILPEHGIGAAPIAIYPNQGIDPEVAGDKIDVILL